MRDPGRAAVLAALPETEQTLSPLRATAQHAAAESQPPSATSPEYPGSSLLFPRLTPKGF